MLKGEKFDAFTLPSPPSSWGFLLFYYLLILYSFLYWF